jgi:hypothetical protein
MPETENTSFSKRLRRMLGLSLHAWENVMLIFLGVAAIAAVFVGISTYAVVRLQKVEAEDARKDLEEYKLDAGQKIAEANARAEEAQLETEKIKKSVSWRVIPPDSALELEKVLSAKPGAVNLRFVDGDPEALYLATQISQILTKAHWQIATGAVKFSNAIVFGISLPDASGAAATTLRDAFSAAKEPFSTAALPEGIGFLISTIAGAPRLVIGSKRPALP